MISRVTNDTEVIRDLYVTVVATVLRSAALVGASLKTPIKRKALSRRVDAVVLFVLPGRR